MHKQAITRAGNHDRQTQQTPGHQCRPTTLHEPLAANPDQAAKKESDQHTTLISHRTLCHRGTSQRHRGAASTTRTAGSHVVHIQLKPRRRGNPQAPMTKPRHASAGELGRNRQNGRTLGWSRLRKHVTKRRNRENRCNSANKSRKPQKAHSKTQSRPTSADQQHKNGSTRTRPQTAGDDKKHPTRTGATETNKATHTAPNSPDCDQIKA